MPTATVLDVRGIVIAHIRDLLGSASDATIDAALAHFNYLWSDGSEGAYSDNAHSVVWAAVIEAYAQQGLASLDTVPRMLRGAVTQVIQHCPLP